MEGTDHSGCYKQVMVGHVERFTSQKTSVKRPFLGVRVNCSTTQSFSKFKVCVCIGLISDFVGKCIGEDAKYEGIRLLFDGFQQPLLNKQVNRKTSNHGRTRWETKQQKRTGNTKDLPARQTHFLIKKSVNSNYKLITDHSQHLPLWRFL